MMNEWLLIGLVALFAFGPKKLPLLATHLGAAFRFILRMKTFLAQSLQKEINQQLLQESEEKAKVADKLYQEKKQTCSQMDEKL